MRFRNIKTARKRLRESKKRPRMSLLSGVMDRWQLKQAYKWGKERASAKLRIFQAYREANPDMPDEELYYLTILNTPEFTEITTRQVIDAAIGMAEGRLSNGLTLSSLAQPFCLCSVKHMLIVEELQRFGPSGYPHPYDITEAFRAVDDVIPENL